jgi:hypothetical protein
VTLKPTNKENKREKKDARETERNFWCSRNVEAA